MFYTVGFAARQRIWRIEVTNYRITLQYDGGAYHGWQTQKNAPTVQQTVENALYSLTGAHIRVKGAGRTDAGVHAVNYTASFKSDTTIPAERLPYALNSKLPPDIVCTCCIVADADFDAADSAKAKKYVYKIYNSALPSAFWRGYAWHVKEKLDIDAMRRAACAFLGEHDFIGFCSAGFTVKTTVRTIYSLDIEADGALITLSVVGNGFLYNMVRIMAGTLVFVGNGRTDPSDMESIIASRDRRRAGITAPAHGLFLQEVYYDDVEKP